MPGLQGVHSWEPVFGALEPAAHASHLVDALELAYCPAGHAMQLLLLADPRSELYVPQGHACELVGSRC